MGSKTGQLKAITVFRNNMQENKETYISFILAELEKGTERGKVLAKAGKKWQISVRSFDRLWKVAKERHIDTQKAAQTAMANQSIDAAVKRQGGAIMSKERRMQIATAIAEDLAEQTSDRLKAMDYLSKIEGDYAAIKQDHSGSIDLSAWLAANSTKA